MFNLLSRHVAAYLFSLHVEHQGLLCLLPQPQGLVMGRASYKAPTGTHRQCPNFTVVTLQSPQSQLIPTHSDIFCSYSSRCWTISFQNFTRHSEHNSTFGQLISEKTKFRHRVEVAQFLRHGGHLSEHKLLTMLRSG